MSVVFIEEPFVDTADLGPKGFWRRFVQALDARFADRTRRSVPENTLRRSSDEIARCRRLMRQRLPTPARPRA